MINLLNTISIFTFAYEDVFVSAIVSFDYKNKEHNRKLLFFHFGKVHISNDAGCTSDVFLLPSTQNVNKSVGLVTSN